MEEKEKKKFKPLIKAKLINKYIISLIILGALIICSVVYFSFRVSTAQYEESILQKLDAQELHYDANGPFILVDVNTGIAGVYNGRYRIASTILDDSVLSILEVNETNDIPYTITAIEE